MDDFFRDTLANREFTYQDSYWQGALAMLDRDRRRRRFLLWWWWGGMSLMLLGCTAAWLWEAPAPPASLFANELSWADCIAPEPVATALVTVSAAEITSPAATETSSPKRRTSGKRSREVASSNPPASPVVASQALYETLSLPPQRRQADWEARIDSVLLRSYRLSPPGQRFPRWQATGDWRQHRFHAGLVAGAQLAPAWRGDQVNGPSSSPVIGLAARYVLAPRWNLLAAALYQQRGSLGRQRSFRSIDYGFGSEEEIIQLNTQTLHFLSLPVSIEFQLAQRHGLAIGLEPAWLAGIRTGVSRTTLSNGVNPLTETEGNTWRYPQGYERWDLALQIGYRYSLGQQLRLGTVASYGLRDLTQNDYFQTSFTDRQIAWRLWLEFDLFHPTSQRSSR